MVLPVPLMTRCRIIAVTSHSPLSLYLGVKAVWTCRHDVPPDLRAAPVLLPSRLFGFNPSRLRADAFFRGGAWPSPPRVAAPHEYCRTGTAGLARLAPRRTGRGLWLRPGLLRQVEPKRAVLDAGGSRLYVTKDGLPTRHPASLWSIHATPQARRRNLRQGAFSLVVGVLALPVPGCKPVKPSRGDAESATSPFGSGRPVRPWLVVNPGEGTAAPWASWPQPSSENNFPCATRIPLGTNSFRFQALHGVATAARCGQPIPAGRITTRTHWRDLVQPERRNIMANIGTFTAEKTASPASSAP